jgi:DNA repair protein RadC
MAERTNKSKGIVSWPQEERPRERLLSRGAQALTDAELIAILVRVGFKGTSAVELGRQLLKQFGSLRAMVEAPVIALLNVKGLKGAKAVQLLAAMEIARRVAVPAQRSALMIKSTTGAAEYLRERMCGLSEEQFRVLYLNRGYRNLAMIRQMLIVGCSKRKRAPAAGLRVVAGELYDGTAFRIIKAWKSRHPSASLTVLILSAKYGLVCWNTPLETYDLRMTKDLATQLRPQVERVLTSLPMANVESVYVELGSDYLGALPDMRRLCPHARIIVGHGKIGQRMRDLRAWLESLETE